MELEIRFFVEEAGFGHIWLIIQFIYLSLNLFLSVVTTLTEVKLEVVENDALAVLYSLCKSP